MRDAQAEIKLGLPVYTYPCRQRFFYTKIRPTPETCSFGVEAVKVTGLDHVDFSDDAIDDVQVRRGDFPTCPQADRR